MRREAGTCPAEFRAPARAWSTGDHARYRRCQRSRVSGETIVSSSSRALRATAVAFLASSACSVSLNRMRFRHSRFSKGSRLRSVADDIPTSCANQQKREQRRHGTHAISLSHDSAKLLDTTRSTGWPMGRAFTASSVRSQAPSRAAKPATTRCIAARCLASGTMMQRKLRAYCASQYSLLRYDGNDAARRYPCFVRRHKVMELVRPRRRRHREVKVPVVPGVVNFGNDSAASGSPTR